MPPARKLSRCPFSQSGKRPCILAFSPLTVLSNNFKYISSRVSLSLSSFSVSNIIRAKVSFGGTFAFGITPTSLVIAGRVGLAESSSGRLSHLKNCARVIGQLNHTTENGNAAVNRKKNTQAAK